MVDAVYGIGIDSSEAERGRDRAVRAFQDIGKGAGGAQSAYERFQRAQENAGRAAADAADQYTKAQRSLIEQAQRQMAVASALDVQSKQSVATFMKENDAIRALAEQSKNLHLVQTQLALAEGFVAEESVRARQYISALNAEVRAGAVMNAEAAAATTANAVAHEAAGVAAMGHGLQLGRLRMELGTLVGRLTGTNTALDRMGGAIAALGLGDPVVIGALAGIAAIGFAYAKLTEDARKAEKAMADAHKELAELEKKREQGPAGQAGAATAAVTRDAAQLLVKIHEEERQLAAVQHGPDMGAATEAKLDAINAALEQNRRAYRDYLGQIQAGTEEAARLRETASTHEHDALVASLAERLQFNQRDSAARKQALLILAADQAEYVKLLLQPFSTDVSEKIAHDASEIKRIQDALNPKTKASADGRKYESEQRALTQMLALDAQRLKAAEELDAAASKGRAEYERVQHTQEIEKAILQEQYAILKDHLDANGKIRAGEEHLVLEEQKAAAERLHHIDEVEQHGRATLEFDRQATESRKAWAREEAQLQKAIADEQQRVAKAMETDMLHAVESFTSRGLNDFKSFFDQVERAALTMTGHLDDALQKESQLFADAMERNDMASAKAISDQMHQIEQLRRLTAPIGAGIAAATTGYQIGQSTGSSTMGAMGGAAAGAIAGSQWGAPGMAIGAFVGLTAGIFGAGKAAAEAAKHMAELQKQLSLSMEALRAEVDHNSLGAGIAQINADREQRRLAIEEALQGGDANSAQVAKRVAALNEMNHLEDVRIKQLIKETAAAAALAEQQKKRDDEDLSVRLLAAQGYTQASSDAAFRNQQQREYQDAVAAKRSPEYLSLLTATQVQEAIQRATQQDIESQTQLIANANKAQQEALDAQLKTANDTLKVNQDALRTAEENARALQQVVDNLKNFNDSLKVSDLSPLSPIDQMAEAKRQLDADYARAQGGDLQAGSDFAGLAKAFLSASREVNASGTAYASDFATVQQMTEALQGKFGPQLSEQQQMVAQLTAANAALQAQIDATQAAKEAAQASADAQTAALTAATDAQTAAIIAGLEKSRNAALLPADSLLNALSSIANSVTGAAQATITAEQSALLESRNAAEAAANAQIEAIRQGKDAATIQNLALVNEMQAARLAANTNAIGVEAELIKNGVLGQSAVDTLVANRQAADTAAQAAIAAVQNGSDAATRDNLQQIAKLEQSRLDANAAAYRQEDALAVQRGVLDRQIAEAQNAEALQAQQIEQIQKQRDAVVGSLSGLSGADAVHAQDQLTAYNNQLEQLRLVKGAEDTQIQKWIDQKTQLDNQIAAVEAVRTAANDKANEQIAALNAIRDKDWTPTIVYTPPAATPAPNTDGNGGGDRGDGARGPDGKPIATYASGGFFGGGMRLVGERGPELEFTGPSRIVSASQTSSLLADALGQSAEMAAKLDELNDSSAATVQVLQAGLLALVQRVEELAARVEENTTATKRGFEGMG